ncbi:hypothetical protein CVT24_008608 [Panaeolus cyanescens]|uniref:Protein kinase domain-containing protein n=1 Tax=Panaeolus cyanescens TaxID=181874 RepID=A0A409VBA5_9AGAR|nr:hypothetical protein CVT24_008608 [Panaeolus cyanescens]
MADLPTILADVLGEHPLAACVAKSLQQCSMREYVGAPSKNLSEYQDPPSYLSFNDRHIAQEHILKHVAHAPSMVNDLRNLAYDEIRRFAIDYMKREPKLYDRPSYGRMVRKGYLCDSTRVCEAYQASVGDMASQYACKFHINTKHNEWMTVFYFLQPRPSPSLIQEMDLLTQRDDYKPFEFGFEEDILRTIDDSVKERIQAYGEVDVSLAVFQFLAEKEASRLIITNSVNADSTFQWTTSRTTNAPTIPSRTQYISPDCPDTFWSKYPSASKRKAKSRSPRSSSTNVREGAIKKVRLPNRLGNRNGVRRSVAPQFLQRAWARAVEHDATFILLNCGTAERIGIRDRASNTLFLSDIIDPFAPGYGAIHIGLHAALVSDALKRPPPFRETVYAARSVIPPPAHRIACKTQLPEQEEVQMRTHPDEFNQGIAKLNILLISLSFAIYHSEAPSAFLREAASCHPASSAGHAFTKPKPNKSYPRKECAHFVARCDLGMSMKVDVYRGFATIQTESGEMCQPVILKLAKNAEGHKNLLHEYEVYKTLAASNVTDGILMVHGMFQDIETGAFGLLMQDGGTTLYEREQIRLGVSCPTKFRISAAEYEKLKIIVQGINSARVARIRHNDIKPDNICFNADGDWFLIDFDVSNIVTHPEVRIWEDMQTIEDLRDGTFVQGENYY